VRSAISSAEQDLRDAGSVAEMRYEEATELTCDIVLAHVTAGPPTTTTPA